MINWSDWPVGEVVQQLKTTLQTEPVVLLQAPPGAGKSTILPLALLEDGFFDGKKIIMLQPRRIAARAVATRLAALLGEEPGERVGFRIRFEGRESSNTRILVVTEGILVRMLQEDPALEDTGLIIFDEFHERSLHADLSLMLARDARQLLRPDLRLLVMSATLDGDKLASVLKAPVIVSQGRQFPVQMNYVGFDKSQPLAVQVAATIRRALREASGDVLAFLPGTGEIKRTAEVLESSGVPARVCMLYGELPFRQQQQAILPDGEGMRRVVLATSIAETSLTIQGISIVVDSGLSRIPKFDPSSGLTRLVTVPVTLDAADQRAGRAGRLGPGFCYRLWETYRTASLIHSRTPEIIEADLAAPVLELLAWGARDILELPWIDAPPKGHVLQAFELLRQLHAVDERNSITAQGRQMVSLPTHPRLAHMLRLMPSQSSGAAMACDLAALLEERDPLDRSMGADIRFRLEQLVRFRTGERFQGDRQVFERVERLSLFWRKMLAIRSPLEQLPKEPLEGQLLAAAYPDRIGRQMEAHGHRYKLANGRVLAAERQDALHQSPWLVAAVADAGSGEGKVHLAAVVDPEMLSGSTQTEEVVYWNEKEEQAMAQRQVRLGALVISSQQIPIPDKDAATRLMIDRIREMGLGWCQLPDAFQEWQARVCSVGRWDGSGDWPEVSETALLDGIEAWLSPWLDGITTRQALSKLNWKDVMDAWMGFDRTRMLDKLVPEKLTVPTGSQIKLRYFSDGQSPELHVRLQEVFGWMETPKIMNGSKPVMMHLLSPAYRPVQITGDLRSFWANTYHEVRKELRTRYPRHAWPEDPLTAQPVRGAVRRR